MDTKKLNILYLDDEHENLIGFKMSFMPFYDIKTATNARDAYGLLENNEFCVVIVDYKMPDIDGISFIENAKSQFPDLLFIVVTAYADINVVIRAMETHCIYSFIQKPWDFDNFKNTIDRAIDIFRIRKENRQLKEDLIERNIQLEKALDKEKKLNEYKTTFIRNLSHEVRTPLNGIIGFATLTKAMNYDSDISEYVDACIKSSEQLVSTFEQIMIASDIFSASSEVKPVWFNPHSIILEKIDELTCPGSDFAKSPIDLDINFREKIFTDKEKFDVAFSQILHNALKFSKGEKVNIKIEQKADRLIISIADQGCGIDKEIEKSIYTPFFQKDASITREYNGVGLGLFIAKSFIEMLNGSISFKPAPEKGTVFSIDLPLLYRIRPLDY